MKDSKPKQNSHTHQKPEFTSEELMMLEYLYFLKSDFRRQDEGNIKIKFRIRVISVS